MSCKKKEKSTLTPHKPLSDKTLFRGSLELRNIFLHFSGSLAPDISSSFYFISFLPSRKSVSARDLESYLIYAQGDQVLAASAAYFLKIVSADIAHMTGVGCCWPSIEYFFH